MPFRSIVLPLVFAAFVGMASAQAPTAKAVLEKKPVIEGVTVGMPATAADFAACTVEERKWAANAKGIEPTGVIVYDAAKRKLRQFVDTTGSGRYDIQSYYLDGAEVFREMETNGKGKFDTFRWLGANGSKIGLDKTGGGMIDTWVSISAEELSLELFAAVQNRDLKRLNALMLTENDVKGLNLPAGDATKFTTRIAGAGAKMVKANAEMKLTSKAKFVHVEMMPPQTTPREALPGAAEDMVRHKSIPVMVDAAGDGKTMSFFSTGEMILVGRTWKLVDGPSAGISSSEESGEVVANIPEAIRPFVEKLNLIKYPESGKASELSQYHLARANLLEMCVDKTEKVDQLPWLKQLIDAYSAGVESAPDDLKAFTRFKEWNDAIQKTGADETKAYMAFRYGAAEYAIKLKEVGTESKKMAALQTWRKENLEAFVKNHGASSDAPDALMQLAISAEFAPKDAEAQAKAYYEKIIKDFPANAYAAKAAGAIKRLGSEGKMFEISGETLDSKAFNEKVIAGKPAVVLYWATWATKIDEELKGLAALEKEFAAKGLVVVTVSLDDDAKTAAAAIRTSGLAGYHLFAVGGLDRSPLATSYGIPSVPHIMLIGKDGKVVNRAAQNGSELKADVEKLVK